MKNLVLCLMTMALISCGEDDETATADVADNFTLTGSGALLIPGLHGGVQNLVTTASTPAIAKLTIYKFAVSASADCSSPITVLNNEAGIEVDMEKGPTIGTGVLADGTYPCVILEMDDDIKFTSTTTDGSCAADTEYTINVCRQFSPTTTITSTLVDGTTVTCTDAKEKVAVYISTNAANSTEGMDPFNAPTSAGSASGITLGSALVVTGATSGAFRMDTSNKVDGSKGDSCDMGPPSFSFSTGS